MTTGNTIQRKCFRGPALDDDAARARPEARNTPMVVANLPRRFADFGLIPPTPANFGPTFAAPAACRGVGHVHIYMKAASSKAGGLITSHKAGSGDRRASHVLRGRRGRSPRLRRPHRGLRFTAQPPGFLYGRLACNDL